MEFTKTDSTNKMLEELDNKIELLVKEAESPKQIGDVLELLEEREKIKNQKMKISPDTLAVIAGNLLGIGLILNYEKLNVISTKALGFVLKGHV